MGFWGGGATYGERGLFGSEFGHFGYQFVALLGGKDAVEPGGAFVEHAAYGALEGARGSANYFGHGCGVWRGRCEVFSGGRRRSTEGKALQEGQMWCRV